MTIDAKRNGTEVVIKVVGRVDSVTAPDFEKAVNENIEGAESLVFDFENLDYISSAGLRVLLMSQKKANANSCKMKLINVNETVNEILEVTGFLTILSIE
ncbi:MAG: STAS domain-containing protein [Clostridia bacterium]|nr:STAS domain-containing protein [Clostridia bacterium]